jgi:hypothetical protein
MDLPITISGDRLVATELEALPERIHRRLVARVTALTDQLLGAYRAGEPRRTGKLRSETVSKMEVAPDLVRGLVTVAGDSGQDFAKAGALEYGARGSVEVKAFSRAGRTPLGTPAEQTVAAYTRQYDIIARRYARGALDDMRSHIESGIAEAVADG